MEITDWRSKIDAMDEEIVQLLNKRAAAAIAIGELKARQGSPIYEPQRERDVFSHVHAVSQGPLSEAHLQDIYQRVMDIMRTLQRPK